MGDSDKNICNETPPECVLLPRCTEANVDVFLNILKNAVARSRIDDCYLDNAFRTGMAGDILSIRANDTSVNWQKLQSKSQQVRQTKLLGHWAIQNYPLLGKKLFGESYNAPERKSVEIVGNENISLMNADEVDAFIFRKMELRVIELSVSQSTWVKLKHFVKVPVSIRKYNELKLSPKMKSFNIDNNCLENCWKALKFGKFSTNEALNHSLNKPVNVNFEQPLYLNTELMLSQPNSNVAVESCREQTISGSGPQLAKRVRLDYSGLLVENTTDLTESFGDSAKDSPRMVLMEIRENIGTLTKWFDPSVAGHHNDINGPERLHIMIIKQKDVEIARMKLLTEELKKENENLNKEKLSMKGQMKSDASLINALQKGVEGNYKLHMKSEDDLGASLKLIETLESEAAKDKTLESEVKNQIQNLNIRLIEAEKIKVEMTEKNEKLEEKLNKWRNYIVAKEKELEESKRMEKIKCDDNARLEEQLNHLKNYKVNTESALNKQIQELINNLTEAEKMNLEMAEKNIKLEEDLIGWKDIAAKQEKQLEEATRMEEMRCHDKRKLEEELNDLKNDVTSMVSEMKNEIENCEKNLNEMTAKNGKLVEDQNGWKIYVVGKEKELEELQRMEKMKCDDNVKLKEQLNHLKNCSVNTESALNQVQVLINKLAVAEKNNLEMSAKIKKLEEDIIVWKDHSANKEKELENTNIILNKTPSSLSGLSLPESCRCRKVCHCRKVKIPQQNPSRPARMQSLKNL